MRPSRVLILFWGAVIAGLLAVEFAELTHLFRIPLASAIGNPVGFIVALSFTTIVALVGAIFIGIYISQRLQSSGGFTPFEEEMLKMRADVTALRQELERVRGASAPPGSDREASAPPRSPS
jgi:hypothetical protein